jgi:hypothetical protein
VTPPEDPEVSEPTRPRRRWRARALIYTVLLLALGLVASLFRGSPQEEAAHLLKMAYAAKGEKLAFSHGGGYLGFLPGHGYVLTLHVGGSAKFEPAEYLTLRRLGTRTLVEIMIASDDKSTGGERVLTPQEAEIYLARTNLSFQDLDTALDTLYGPRAK